MVEVARLDLLDTYHASFPALVTARICSFAKNLTHAAEPEKFARTMTVRALAGDPGVLILGGFDGPKLVAHALVEIIDTVTGRCAFVHQTEVDPGYTGLVDKLLEFGDTWGKSMQTKVMRIETNPNKHSVKAWTRLYGRLGFKAAGFLMEREIP